MNLPPAYADGGVRCAICIHPFRVGAYVCPDSSGCASRRRERQMRQKVGRVLIQDRCLGGPVHFRVV